MAEWKVLFISFGITGKPEKVTQAYASKEIAEEHARFVLRALREDSDYAGFKAYITPPPGEGKPYMYIKDKK